MIFLRRREDFLALRNAEKIGCRGFLLLHQKSPVASVGARVGITVTKKQGNAVVRNRIRRRLRAVIHEVFPLYASAGCDYVFIARKAAYDRNFDAMVDDLKQALLRLSADHK